MKQFIVNPSYWDLFPDAVINILVLEGIDNHYQGNEAEYEALLKEGGKAAQAHLTEDTFSQNPAVAIWREAFKTFKTKKGARSSIEALLKRISQGHEFSPIIPLVDIYNYASLKYGVPVGGEDIDKMAGDIHLGTAQGGEAFLPLGSEEDAPALEGEVIYYDSEGAICRCLNWREAQRTMLTEDTTNAFIIVDNASSQQAEAAGQAIAEIQALAEKLLGVKGKIQTLTKENPQADLM
ncbi:B3/B4 domain-containing protein [Eremococcus coleocola]|uniref:B3/4 domain protein n=1 Tax=Eremococcus coleocola ACS-139-V-Col8 TaxID=908337 RepID=E4KQY2_9LACT|nr:phenylalanine--tRNA ligase beta subunit-related protein [Eremococcus coleocola]EFR30749.1 B3/4 domain protein [Eremococcus coleocola ACS-139-V-Col8]